MREPGGTPLGERIRELLLDGPEMTAWAEAALFAAARAELAERVIRPALERGAWVVCDRYVDSSLAYQGGARGLGIEAVRELNLAATGGLAPDMTFVLLVDPDVALRAARRPRRDRIEREAADFVRRVDRGYRELVAPRRALRRARRPVPADELARRSARVAATADPGMSSFDRFPEQHEAKRLLDAALDEGPRTRTSSTGRTASASGELARAFARELVGTTREGASRHLPARAARRDDPDRRDPRAAARPAHAAVRGRPARLPDLQRRPDERRRGRRAAQGPRGASVVRGDRARRRRPRADHRDDPLALPARPVPAALRARGARRGRARARPSSTSERQTALARVAAGRLDRLERLLDPRRRRAPRDAARAGARRLRRAGVRAGRRRDRAARERAPAWRARRRSARR